ncbi:MAG: hypothetical protein JWM11_4920 [Planctomycetaceae bacterium]|nr:hypothetical protein [Planctomycetaceae bacterium]
MVSLLEGEDSLRRMFQAYIEQTFQVELGIADPPLTDYLTDMLLRFLRTDLIYRMRNLRGRRMQEVTEMLTEARERQAKPQRELYRHIGDFTLFWSGLYPEALPRLQSPDSADSLLDYREQGKRSYYLASTYQVDPFRDEAPVLRRLSEEFDICSVGLRQVRKEWEKLPLGESQH